MMTNASAGGAATASGMDFQHRVAAWTAVRILAEKDASPPWDLPENTTLNWLQCETKQPVDDLLVGTSNEGFIFAQIKRRLTLSKATTSDLASAIDQFVRQFIACRSKIMAIPPADRPLDPVKDRLILITSMTCPESIRVHFSEVLDQVRNLLPSHSVDEAARNDDHIRVLEVVKAHVTSSWKNVSEAIPSDNDLKEILSLIYVHVLDLDEGCTNECEAKDIIRRAILRDPEKSDIAWTQLINLCAGFAIHRSGADRKNLQRALLNVGIELQSTKSYRNDIEKLKGQSRQIFESLAYLSRIRVGSTEVKIERPCTEALRRASEENSILVVGEPGAGKSGALHNLVDALQKDGRDTIFLAVDRLEARSLGGLRAEIGLNHELSEVLDNWPGLQPAFLVIDALDAARGDSNGKTIRDLIRRIVEKDERWHVVASIRKFDLRYGFEIKQLFIGEPSPEFQDAEFGRVRHLNIPRLSKEEIGQISLQSPKIFSLLTSAPPELYELLRVPFNLQLVAEMLGVGDIPDELLPIRTQLGLLDGYWLCRVIREDGLRDAREALLRDICEKMVAERALRVNRSIIARPETSILLQDLLSIQVLNEWQPSPEMPPEQYILAFSHHVLFDYAVARLLLREGPEIVVHRILKDPHLVVVIRPSFLLHFRHFWTIGISKFWDLIFRVNQADRIPEIGKLIGPSVAAELARTQIDLEPLVLALDNPIVETRSAAEQALRHLVGALLAAPPGETRLVGHDAGPWCELIEHVSRSLRHPVTYSVQSLLTTVCEHPEYLTIEQRITAGQAARRLLDFGWSVTPRDRRLVIHALRSVCRTFESDTASTVEIIRRCLEPVHLSQFGFEEMPWLADEVERLIPLDPGLVEEIYRAAFGYNETSNETTPIGQSRILPLSSNRRQDYDMALYKLAEVFPQFLDGAPERATRALIAVLESYVAQDHPLSASEVHEEIFDFSGIQARLLTDYSAIWDHDVYRNDEPLQMLDAFQRYLEEIAKQPDRIEQLRNLIQILVDKNRLAVLWSRLLLSGSRFPITLGREILPLSWTMPILTGYDTKAKVGEFLSAIFPTIDHEERERIEQAILMIPETVPEDHIEEGERIRNYLLGCLANENIITAEARSVLELLKSKNAIPTNEPLVSFGPVVMKPRSGKEYLEDRGVPVETEANKEILGLEYPVKEFEEKHRKSDLTSENLNEIFPALQELHNALSQAEEKGVHPKLRDHAWSCLAEACALIAKNEGLLNNEELIALVRSVLLGASQNPEPLPSPEHDPQFDEHLSWGLPAARIQAAIGLIMLARHPTLARPDVLEAIVRLSKDPVPAVRFQIVANLTALYKTARELMWQIIELTCSEEQSRGVLQGLLGGGLRPLAHIEPDRVTHLTKAIFDKVRDGPGANKVRGSCVNIFSDLYIWRGHSLCGKIAREIASNPIDCSDEAHYVLMKLRKPLTYGPTNLSDLEADAVRERAFELLEILLQSSHEGLRQLEVRHPAVQYSGWPTHDQEKAKSIARLIDRVGSEVYFASGAYDDKRQGQIVHASALKPESLRFYRDASVIFDKLANVAQLNVAHHLLETLEFFITLEPREVFIRIGKVVRAGQQGGYQYESVAANLVVKLVERYLAEYRTLLKEDEKCRQILIDILDAFIQAGWPSAQRLTYRLEEIFR